MVAIANGMRGDVPFQAQGRTWVLNLDFNSLKALEGVLPDIMRGQFEITTPSIMAAVFREALMGHQPEIGSWTDSQIGDLIQARGMKRVMGDLQESILFTFGMDPASIAEDEAANHDSKAEAAPEATARPRSRGRSPGP